MPWSLQGPYALSIQHKDLSITKSLSMLALKSAAERSPIVEMAMVDRRLVEGVFGGGQRNQDRKGDTR